MRYNGFGYRLLLLDGHATHLIPAFLDACGQARIIIALFPSHSTSLMQPLDVGCFGPLSVAYLQALEILQSSLLLASSMTKADFWRLFEQVWKASLTKINIISAFAAAGVYPIQARKVLSKIPEDKAEDSNAELSLTHKIRHLRKVVKENRSWADPAV